MEETASDTSAREAAGQTDVAPVQGASAPSGAVHCACGCDRGKPNYSRTVVAIWAAFLMSLFLVGYYWNQNRTRTMNELQMLVAQASQLYDQQQFEQSTELLRQAAERGYAPAQTYYGGSLKMGIGVPQDMPGAVEWYRKAAAQKYPYAYFELAICCQNGYGVERDLDQAETWYRKAYDAGLQEQSRRALDELDRIRARESGIRTP